MATDALARGREAYERRAWADSCALLSAADRQASLDPDDLERLATAAYLAGREEDCSSAWARAHQERLARGEVERAVRCAFWLAFASLNSGELARGTGWLARARRLLDDAGRECVEQGYLLLPIAFQHIGSGDYARAADTYGEAARTGSRFGEPDLVALALHGRGRALVRLGQVGEGVALLDEAMVAVEAGGLSPIVVGDVYCSVIAGCLEIGDFRRAREWTTRMTRWCEAQPGLVAYGGQCLVRRAEILHLQGNWAEAAEAVSTAFERGFDGPDRAAIGSAWYERAELHRLRGASEAAEESYREAARSGRSPQPGLALLRLSQGQVLDAAAAIRRAVDQAAEPRLRARLLPTHVEVLLAAGEIIEAREAAKELGAVAAHLGAHHLQAAAAQARGAVLLAGGDSLAALAALQEALTRWCELDLPYEAARARILLAACLLADGDAEAARMERETAAEALRGLGATPDLARLTQAGRDSTPKGPLSRRESEVLRLLATGRTNRTIAAALCISERTVERHVSNIFVKLHVASRAAATAYAYEHRLL